MTRNLNIAESISTAKHSVYLDGGCSWQGDVAVSCESWLFGLMILIVNEFSLGARQASLAKRLGVQGKLEANPPFALQVQF